MSCCDRRSATGSARGTPTSTPRSAARGIDRDAGDSGDAVRGGGRVGAWVCRGGAVLPLATTAAAPLALSLRRPGIGPVRGDLPPAVVRIDSRRDPAARTAVSYTHLRAHETPEHLVCRLLLE